MKKQTAENIALQAFAWLSSDPEIAGGFMGLSGASPEELRAGARNPEFLGFVLDYILSDDRYVVECAGAIDLRPEEIAMARHYLPGGDAPDWT